MYFYKNKIRDKEASNWQNYLVSSSQKTSQSPLFIFWCSLLLVMLILVGRLVQLQVVEGAYYRVRAEDNRIITRRLTAERGKIFDRNSNLLTENSWFYKRLSSSAQGEPQWDEISRDQALSTSVEDDEWVFFDVRRKYIYGKTLSHLLGFTAEISKEEIDTGKFGNYVLGDTLGKTGIEKTFEDYLRGEPGFEQIEVNSKGELERKIGHQEPKAGKDLKLSLDLGLQQRLDALLEGKTGSIVATNPKTGEILALVSNPSYDPNNLKAALNDPAKPFFNRAISGVYPPGSVYKIITSVAGLEEGKISAETTIEDTGEMEVNGYKYRNWYYQQYGGKDGAVNVVKALQRSNDIYYYKLGEMIGAAKLAEWSQLFGLGSLPNTGLPGEAKGLVPSPEWKRKLGQSWFLGNTYHMAIGQGDLQVSPFQMNAAVAAVANKGRLCPPRLLVTEPEENINCKELGISNETITTVLEGLRAVCFPGGTGFPFFGFEPQVGCKTGTAQTGEGDSTHAWFSVLAPLKDPEIVMTVMIEKGGEGSKDAAPVALKGLEYWFHEKAQNPQNNLTPEQLIQNSEKAQQISE